MEQPVTIQPWLDSLQLFGMKLGLDNMQLMNSLLGDPASRLRFVHVAGTNGKGSTCTYIATAAKLCGLRTGLYTSPFLVDFHERCRIDGKPMAPEAFQRAIAKVMAIEAEVVQISGVRPSYFEAITAAALLVFEEAGCELVIWETGLGGRLDATNIVTPILSVITNIGLDHVQHLGATHAKIAAEKAGILKPGVPLICGVNHPEARAVIEARAKELGCEMRQLDRDFSLRRYRKSFGPAGFSQALDFEGRSGRHQFPIGMGGLHQLDNAACAAAALEILAEKGVIADLPAAFAALVHARLPGRLQVLEKGRLLVDGAHNADGIQSLSRSLSDAFLGQKFHLVCGMMADKDLEALLAAIGPKAASLSCVGVNNPRAMAPELFAERARAVLSCPVAAYANWSEALAVTLVKKDALTLVFGSLYLVGEVLVGLAPESVNSDDL